MNYLDLEDHDSSMDEGKRRVEKQQKLDEVGPYGKVDWINGAVAVVDLAVAAAAVVASGVVAVAAIVGSAFADIAAGLPVAAGVAAFDQVDAAMAVPVKLDLAESPTCPAPIRVDEFHLAAELLAALLVLLVDPLLETVPILALCLVLVPGLALDA